jgi:hypothetical protein
MSALTGECPVDMAGQTYILRFTWAAVAEVHGAYGDDPKLDDLATLAAVGAAGLREHHPEMTAERIAQLSPPVFPFRLAVEQAWRFAFFGPEGVEGLEARVREGSKAGPPAGGSPRPTRWPWKRASTPKHSGA